MSQSRDESPPSRLELVVLACLSQKKPPTDVELGAVIQELALPDESAEAARRRAVELLEGLMRRAWVTGEDEPARPNKGRMSRSPRKLTESGKRALRTAFNVTRVPTWAQVRDKHLPALALGVAPGSELAKKACTENAMMAAVLCTQFRVRDALTPVAVCDALIADALGMPRGKLTLDRIRAHVLTRGIDKLPKDAPSPQAKGYTAKLAASIACSVVGASGTQHKLARAFARSWVCGEANPLDVSSARHTTSEPATSIAAAVASPQPAQSTGGGRARPVASNRDASVRPVTASRAEQTRLPLPDSRSVQPPAPNLLEVVRETIPRVGAEGRFGEKVYVSAIWRTIERDRKVGELSLDHFKRWLLGANRDGWLVLARADLIGAMDARQVTESEINDRGATFHFVLDQRNGASASQRETHAG